MKEKARMTGDVHIYIHAFGSIFYPKQFSLGIEPMTFTSCFIELQEGCWLIATTASLIIELKLINNMNVCTMTSVYRTWTYACCTRRSYTSLFLFKGYIRCIRWTGVWLSQLMSENLFWDPLACKRSLLVLSSSVCVVPVAWMSHTFTDMFADIKYATAMATWGTISRESVTKPRSVCVTLIRMLAAKNRFQL